MSRNGPAATEKVDARVRRTRDRLGDALVALILEKPFDRITVQDVLDRAGVGRSTFYTHYRDKEDLFVSDVDEFLESMATMLSRRNDASDRVAPVRELFAHVADWRRFHSALVTSRKLQDILELAQGHFARAIEQRLIDLSPKPPLHPDRRAAMAQALAGALLSLMSWWLERGMPEPASEMDDIFHRMVWSGMTPTGGRALPQR